MQFLKMTEKLNRYMNKQRKTVHANSTNTIQKLANWKPIKIPPQVILLRLQCVLEKPKPYSVSPIFFLNKAKFNKVGIGKRKSKNK